MKPTLGTRLAVNIVVDACGVVVVIGCLRLKGEKVVEIPISSVTGGCNVETVLGTNVLNTGSCVVVYTGLTFIGVVGLEPIEVV